MPSENNTAHIRILHNIGNSSDTLLSPNVDAYLGGKAVAYNLSYGNFTSYFAVQSGEQKFVVRKTGTKEILTQGRVKLQHDLNYTIIIAGNLSNQNSFTALVYQDSIRCPRPGYALLRFIYATPVFDQSYNVFANGNKIFSDVSYHQTGVPTYIPLHPGATKITVGATPEASSQIAEFNIKGGRIYTVILSSNMSTTVPTAISSIDNKGLCEDSQNNFKISQFTGKWYVIAYIPQTNSTPYPRSTIELTLLSQHEHEYGKMVSKFYNEQWELQNSTTGLITFPDYNYPAEFRFTSGTGSYICNCIIGTGACICNCTTGTGACICNCTPDAEVPSGTFDRVIHDTNYNYAVVGSPNRDSLMILCRKIRMTPQGYRHLVKYSRSLGYDVSLLYVSYHAIYNDKSRKHHDETDRNHHDETDRKHHDETDRRKRHESTDRKHHDETDRRKRHESKDRRKRHEAPNRGNQDYYEFEEEFNLNDGYKIHSGEYDEDWVEYKRK